MHNELADRQQAVRLRLAGESIERICHTLKRTKPWFHKWWQRYLTSGPEGLYDLTRANRQVVNQILPYIGRAVLSIRRRLAARATPETRYTRLGAATIRRELERWACSLSPPRAPLSASWSEPAGAVRLYNWHRDWPRRLPRPTGLRYASAPPGRCRGTHCLTGDQTRYDFLVCKDGFDQVISLEFVDSRAMGGMIPFLSHAWQLLGLPDAFRSTTARNSAAGDAGPDRSAASSGCVDVWVSNRFSSLKASPNATVQSSIATAGFNHCCCATALAPQMKFATN